MDSLVILTWTHFLALLIPGGVVLLLDWREERRERRALPPSIYQPSDQKGAPEEDEFGRWAA